MTILRAELAAAEALAHREMRDRPPSQSSRNWFRRRPRPLFYVRPLSSVALVEAFPDEGSIHAARRAVDEARNPVEGEELAVGGRNWPARAGTRPALAAGDKAAARHWSGLLEDEFCVGVSVARHRAVDG